ncbi:MAG TPA: FKBP-type peptidyl-prolyl cis-trans isomerase [Candidatus Paceibacterota bacterium]
MSSRTLQVGVAVAAALAVIVLFFIFNPFGMQQNAANSAVNPSANSGLVVQDEVVGTGVEAQPGDQVSVNYTGKLENGTVFDTSVGRPPATGCTQGFCFVLGAGKVIPGWDQGVAGMKVGGKRVLIIPPSLAYGAQAVGPIPANSTLTFEVELLGVTPASNVAPTPEGAPVQ